jgi:hypothetical protein
MRHSILNPEYEANFVDTEEYPPSTPFLLRGLAAAIQDAGSSWRPLVSELAHILIPLPADHKDDLVASGAAYGAAKSISNIYPGPGLLLYGSIVNRLYQDEDVDLTARIENACNKLKSANLLANEDIKVLVEAAKERARMGRISAAMRKGFKEGLMLSNKYDHSQAIEIAENIVETTHDVRHRALIDRFKWLNIFPTNETYRVDFSEIKKYGTTDIFQTEPPFPETRTGGSLYQELVPHAQIACAYLLFKDSEHFRANQVGD